MGSGHSTQHKDVPSHVFTDELTELDEIVNKIVSPDDKFTNPHYNFLFEDVCNKYTILWEKELNKHLKVDLEGLSGSIYLIPKKDTVSSEDDKVILSKQDLCKSISKHYVKILYILSLVKAVYDLEGGGDDSLAGIMKRNIHISNDIMQINYCSVPHRDYAAKNSSQINFSNLEGLQMFVEHFLTAGERDSFLTQMKAIFARRTGKKLDDALCNDPLVPVEVYKKAYAHKLPKGLTCDKQMTPLMKKPKSVDLLFEVVENNPILHSHYCGSQKKVLISLKSKTKDNEKVMELYNAMHKNYKDNIAKVMSIMQMLVSKHRGDDGTDAYKLKDLSNDDLAEIIKKVKQTIILFYVQSIIDFQVLLDFAKTISSIRVEK